MMVYVSNFKLQNLTGTMCFSKLSAVRPGKFRCDANDMYHGTCFPIVWKKGILQQFYSNLMAFIVYFSARCFFGPWGDYDECQNGVQKKKRQVIQGGLECERKGVKIKSC